MIMLSGKNKVDCSQYDHVWYVTCTCPGMRQGCEHHPELAASKETHSLCFGANPNFEEFYKQYVKEMITEPILSRLKDLVKHSEDGEWFQLVFYEDSPEEGERPYLYAILRAMTEKVFIE